MNITRIPLSEKDSILAEGPRKAKAHIARDIVQRFHGEKAAEEAEDAFEKTFAKGGVPDDVAEIEFKGGSLAEALIKAEVIPSKTEWRRLIDGGAVRDEQDEKIVDTNFAPTKTMILKIGKRRFVKIVV